MRIISQDGTIDVPYESFVISVNMQNKGEIIAWTGNHISDDECIVMAVYSSFAKAQKAMEMLRKIYTGRFVTNTDVPDDFNERFQEFMKYGFGAVVVKETNDNRVDNLEILSPREHCLETIRQNPHCLDGMIAYNKGRIIDDGRKRYKKSKEPKSRFKYGKIMQYSLDGEFINSFCNAADAYRDTGVCQRNILQVANGTPFNDKGSVRKQAGGYVWKFEKEVV